MASRSVVVLFAIVALTYSLELPPELQEFVDDLHDTCIKQAGVSEADHAAYDVINNPHDKKLQCYMKCLMLESKWMKPDGSIDYTFILNTAHPDIVDILTPVIDKCRIIEDGGDLCEKASNFNACMYHADKDNWFLV